MSIESSSDVTKHIVRTTTKLSVYKVVVYVHQTDSHVDYESKARVQAPQQQPEQVLFICLVPMYKQAVRM
jgi:hypothetical protein